MFEENRVLMMALGSQHAVALSIDDSSNTARSTDHYSTSQVMIQES